MESRTASPVLLSAPGYDTISPLMIREAVIAERQRREWTDNQLAQSSGVPYSRLYQWLYQGKTISSKHIEALMETLGLRVCRGKGKGK